MRQDRSGVIVRFVLQKSIKYFNAHAHDVAIVVYYVAEVAGVTDAVVAAINVVSVAVVNLAVVAVLNVVAVC